MGLLSPYIFYMLEKHSNLAEKIRLSNKHTFSHFAKYQRAYGYRIRQTFRWFSLTRKHITLYRFNLVVLVVEMVCELYLKW